MKSKNTYQFKLVCRCPNDDAVNIYNVQIFADYQIQVEEFIAFQNEIYNQKLYQEDIWNLLAEKYGNSPEYDNIVVTGRHLDVEVVTK